jgi:hypothetical protein
VEALGRERSECNCVLLGARRPLRFRAGHSLRRGVSGDHSRALLQTADRSCQTARDVDRRALL